MQLGDPDMYSAGNPLQATTTTLKGASGLPPTGALRATKVNYGILE
jgi:hypothetical protein